MRTRAFGGTGRLGLLTGASKRRYVPFFCVLLRYALVSRGNGNEGTRGGGCCDISYADARVCV